MPRRTVTTLTFAEAWETWLAYRTCNARPLRASTLADYESIYRRHLGPHLAHEPLAEINGIAIARLTIALSRSGVHLKRLSNVLVPLRACLRWHYRVGSLPGDPSRWFEPSAPAADERRILTPGEIERLLGELPAHYRPFVEFAAYVGTRAGEQRALTWDDLDLDSGIAHIDKTYFRTTLQRSTKTGVDRVVPIPPHVVPILRAWRDFCPPSAQGLVFPSRSGAPLDLDDFRARIFKPAVERAGLPPGLRFHDLRHTAASLYLSSGATVRDVMEICGWSQLSTAQRYLHSTGSLSAAAERLSASRDAALNADHTPADASPM